MKIGLYVMTAKGAAVLRAAIASGVDVAYVVTASDPGMVDDGRIEILRLADAADIEVHDRLTPVPDTATHTLAAGWRQLLDVRNLIVLHDSLLPRYRGFAPLPTALIKGDSYVGVTAILATGEADHGPIVAQTPVEVTYPARIRDVIDEVALVYYAMTLDLLADWPTRGREQDEKLATYSVWRDELDYRIDWTQTAEQIRRLVDAVGHPYRGAATFSTWPAPIRFAREVRVLAAEEDGDVTVEDRRPGKTLFVRDGCPVVICGRGLLRLTDVRSGDSVLPLPLRTRFA